MLTPVILPGASGSVIVTVTGATHPDPGLVKLIAVIGPPVPPTTAVAVGLTAQPVKVTFGGVDPSDSYPEPPLVTVIEDTVTDAYRFMVLCRYHRPASIAALVSIGRFGSAKSWGSG